MRSLLQRISLAAGRHPYRVFVGFFILVVISLGLIRTLQFDTDVTNLLPSDDETVDTFRRSMEEFGSIDLLLVAVRIPEGVPIGPYETFVGRLAGELEQLDEIEYVDYKLGTPEELIEAFLPRFFLFLDEHGRERAADRLSDQGVVERARELKRLIATPQAMALKSLLLMDPMGVSEIFLESVGLSSGAIAVDLSSGYYLSRDQRMMLVLAKPIKPAQDIDFDIELVAACDAVSARVISTWPEIAGIDPPPAPEVALGGGYLTALDDASLIKGDIVGNAVTSMAVVLALFLWAFRRLSPLFYAFVPLTCGIILTFGFAALAMGSLSSATSGVAALLIGLAIDFVIVSYGRYVEERRAGSTVEESIVRMSGSSGRAVVVGGITSAATFYAFLVTDFRGLEQMGLLAGTGILLCMASVLLLLPAMLVWGENRHAKLDSTPNLYLHGFGTSQLMRWCYTRPRLTLALGAIVTIVLGWQATELRFEHNMRDMRAPDNRGIQVLDEVSSHFGSGFEFMSLMVEGESLSEVLEAVDAAAKGARRLVEEGVLDGYEALTSIVPPLSQQEASIAWLQELEAEGLGAVPVRERIEGALTDAGLRPEPFGTGLDLLQQAMELRQPITVQDLERGPQSERLVARYIRRTETGWVSVVKLFPPPKEWKRQPPPPVVELAESLGPQVKLTGVNVLSEHLRGKVRWQAVFAALLGLLLVAILLWIDFRHLGDTFLSLAPLAVGVVWMLGLMHVFGLVVNLFNIFVTTMIIGIGVDYGIHALHRFRECRDRGHEALMEGLLETGKAVVLASLSTVVGFGSMSLSNYPGLRSVGWVAILGALATAFVSITLLPAYFSLSLKRTRSDS
ncbi:MAG: MMPL family transporter [Thermoanaerobaculia bacterium]|nr:MMPL family transporter [Thermoanaerobaculia bacterium]